MNLRKSAIAQINSRCNNHKAPIRHILEYHERGRQYLLILNVIEKVSDTVTVVISLYAICGKNVQ